MLCRNVSTLKRCEKSANPNQINIWNILLHMIGKDDDWQKKNNLHSGWRKLVICLLIALALFKYGFFGICYSKDRVCYQFIPATYSICKLYCFQWCNNDVCRHRCSVALFTHDQTSVRVWYWSSAGKVHIWSSDITSMSSSNIVYLF